jgi:hypothetical protein
MVATAQITPALADSFERLRASFTDPWALNYITWHQRRCADDALRLARLVPGGRILNVGGAPYIFEVAGQALGLRIRSLDIAPERHADVIAAFGLDVLKANFEQSEDRAAVPLGDFEAIVLCEIIEHMRIDLIATLDDVRNRMARSAIVYITTPNFYYAPRFVSMLSQRVREYSRRELEELFHHVGFVSRCEMRNSSPLPKSLPGLAARWAPLAKEFVFQLTPR